MNGDESARRWFTLSVVIVTMCCGSYLGATHHDEQETRALAFMIAVAVVLELAVRACLVRARDGRTSLRLIFLSACVAAFVTVRCSREAFGLLWVKTAALPGETSEQTFARHKERAHALVEIQLPR